MSKRRQQQRARQRARTASAVPSASAAKSQSVKLQPAKPAAEALPPVPAGTRPDFRRISRTAGFRWSLGLVLLGFLGLGLSQAIPHDYGFLELGFLFTLSVYDLVLAMLGLAVAAAVAPGAREMRIIFATFLVVLVAMLSFFDPIFRGIMASPLGEVLYLVAPAAVISTGAALWVPGRWAGPAAAVAAAIVAFSFSLFVGLDDLGIGILDFTTGTVLCALWLVVAPALLLRQFRGPWLVIPSRIVGSWLVVIGIIVLGSLYMPQPENVAPPPPPGDLQLVIPEDGSAPTLNGEELPLDDGSQTDGSQAGEGTQP
ncbi:hypothetical protein [Ciceribacter ferrooxidans]|uniref:Uncharacterized protein n=1 Tax=Ciceribacter ferrooxidans TaxID=2509717 RepID=A0A4Q2TE96_9HYPH|nr:hypothetical protein [Ciceribacter ferrooxidans]RYC15330.1 hypothetical protein EUU22_09880 [Ciceribacter ferrooxidans]